MPILVTIVMIAGTFVVCWLVDQGFTKLFRNQPEHFSGKSIRQSKKYAAIGLILSVLGIAGLLSGLPDQWMLIAGSLAVAALGIGLVVYYMTFGIFYDADTFLVSTFAHKTEAYHYGDICGQLLYRTANSILVELHMRGGNTVVVPLNLENAEAFLDHAFEAWCSQKFKLPEDCAFHDPDNSLWFPTMQEKS